MKPETSTDDERIYKTDWNRTPITIALLLENTDGCWCIQETHITKIVVDIYMIAYLKRKVHLLIAETAMLDYMARYSKKVRESTKEVWR